MAENEEPELAEDLELVGKVIARNMCKAGCLDQDPNACGDPFNGREFTYVLFVSLSYHQSHVFFSVELEWIWGSSQAHTSFLLLDHLLASLV